MSDLISKQRAIEAIDRFIPADPMMSEYTQGISVGLAIATRCIEKFSQENDDSSQGLVKDLISRKDAIDAVEFGITYAKAIDVNTGESKELFKEGNDALKKAVERLKELPSAQPGRKTAEWIYGENGGQDGWYCSKCGLFIPWDYEYYGLDNIDFIADFHTCPKCDRKMLKYTGMRGEQE